MSLVKINTVNAEKKLKILLTGGNGFIGRYVLESLSGKGHDVIVISSKNIINQSSRISWLCIDLHDRNAVATVVSNLNASILIHLAWYTKPVDFWSASENLEWVASSKNLFKAFIKSGGTRIIAAGTCAEYHWNNEYCLEKSTPIWPLTAYGKSKDLVRVILEDLSTQSHTEWAWARIFSPFGFGEPLSRFIPHAIRCIADGRHLSCSAKNQYRDYLTAAEVAEGIVHLACGTSISGAFNVSSGRPIRLEEIIEIVCDVLQKSPTIGYGDIPFSPLNPQFLAGGNARIKNTGWQPRCEIRDNLKKLIELYIRRG